MQINYCSYRSVNNFTIISHSSAKAFDSHLSLPHDTWLLSYNNYYMLYIIINKNDVILEQRLQQDIDGKTMVTFVTMFAFPSRPMKPMTGGDIQSLRVIYYKATLFQVLFTSQWSVLI